MQALNAMACALLSLAIIAGKALATAPPEEYHRLLDELAAQGQGVIHREVAQVQSSAPVVDERPVIRPRSRAAEQMYNQRVWEQRRGETATRNAQSEATLKGIVDEVKRTCGEKMTAYPSLGMSDADFRNCTTHARFGNVAQIVAVEQDGIALRLYIFPTERARRVYSVGGVVTAIK